MAQLKDAGLGVAAISYDSPATLKRFSDAYNIGYPLLSDQGSMVIRKFGIFNDNIPEGNMFHGIPFPGDYVLAPDGSVISKHFLPNYQTRPTASAVLLSDFDAIGAKGGVTIAADDIRATIALSSAVTAPGQELGVAIDVTIAPGWHIYGEPLPQNYTATSVTFTGDAITKQSMSFPPARPTEFKSLNETLPVYEGALRAKGTILISGRIKPGDHKLNGTLKFQECNETTCKIPQQVAFEIPIKVEPMTPPAKK
jgi:hypothetical protein